MGYPSTMNGIRSTATISTLGQIGGGDMNNGYPGCERGLDVIIAALDVTEVEP
jgi:hypothetical protein